MIAGLLAPSGGRVEVFGEPLTGINRRATYMFQQDALLPWKTVLGNIQFGLIVRGRNGIDSSGGRPVLGRTGRLEGVWDHLYPYQLSGGMRKRVALAQCWIVQPDVILMDEPFSALDVHTRLRMESEILALWAGSGKTVMFVTHDLEEAIALVRRGVPAVGSGPGARLVGRYPVDLARPTTPDRHQGGSPLPSALPNHLERAAARGAEQAMNAVAERRPSWSSRRRHLRRRCCWSGNGRRHPRWWIRSSSVSRVPSCVASRSG